MFRQPTATQFGLTTVVIRNVEVYILCKYSFYYYYIIKKIILTVIREIISLVMHTSNTSTNNYTNIIKIIITRSLILPNNLKLRPLILTNYFLIKALATYN